MKKKLLFIILLLITILPTISFAKSKFFYDVIKDANKSGYSREYTEKHQDSIDESLSTEKVYYWYAYNNSDANEIIEMNNVIFGNFCWQMLRTTDTGGVRLIYNGVPSSDGKCKNTGSATTIGTSYFNSGSTLPNVGYMYNKSYSHYSLQPFTETISYSGTLSTSWYYSEEATYSANYKLANPYQISSADDFSSLESHYTLSSSSQNTVSSSVKYIFKVNNSTYYYFNLYNNNEPSYYNNHYTYGDSYIDNGDGTFTINNASTIESYDFDTVYIDLRNKYICKNAINDTCNGLWYAVGTTTTNFTYLKVQNVYKFANSFVYEDGTYKLSGDSFTNWNYIGNISQLYSRHYTCFNESGECTSISYVYHYDDYILFYYKMSNGRNIRDLVNDMLYVEDVNTTNSTVKSKVDTWYRNNLINYTDYIDDTIYCGDRSFGANGFEPDGSVIVNWSNFNSRLTCTNETDQFSVSNPKASLTYPIALPNHYEMSYLINNKIIRSVGTTYWTMSPAAFYRYGASVRAVGSDGTTNTSYGMGTSQSIRPVISLKKDMGYIEGDGSKDNPYIATQLVKYKVNVAIKNETKDLTIEKEDVTKVDADEEILFKVTPIKGYKVNGIQIIDSEENEVEFTETENKNEYSFIMPASDVTIIPSYEKTTATVEIEDNKNTKELTVQVNDVKAVVYEDVVKFTVEPVEGYELEDIIIVDEDDNEIEYHKTNKENEYEFVMPDKDVVIKPIYKKIDIPQEGSILPNNPKTGKNIALIIITIVVISVWTFMLKQRKSAI